VLGSLSPGHRYDITVIAVNTAGLGKTFDYTAATGKFWGGLYVQDIDMISLL
jgi:hypothetical protein